MDQTLQYIGPDRFGYKNGEAYSVLLGMEQGMLIIRGKQGQPKLPYQTLKQLLSSWQPV